MDRVLQVVPESLRSQFVCNASVQGRLIIYGLQVKVRREISQSATFILQVSRVPRLSCKYRECHVYPASIKSATYPASIESATCILQVSRVPRTLRVSRVPRTLQISRVPLSGLWSRVQRILRYCNYQERNISYLQPSLYGKYRFRRVWNLRFAWCKLAQKETYDKMNK